MKGMEAELHRAVEIWIFLKFVIAATSFLTHPVAGDISLFQGQSWRKIVLQNTTKSWCDYARAIIYHSLEDMNLFVANTKMREGNVLVQNQKFLASKLRAVKGISLSFAHQAELSALVLYGQLAREW